MDGQKICQDNLFSPTEFFPHRHRFLGRLLIDFQAMVQLDNPQVSP